MLPDILTIVVIPVLSLLVVYAAKAFKTWATGRSFPKLVTLALAALLPALADLAAQVVAGGPLLPDVGPVVSPILVAVIGAAATWLDNVRDAFKETTP